MCRANLTTKMHQLVCQLAMIRFDADGGSTKCFSSLINHVLSVPMVSVKLQLVSLLSIDYCML